MPSVAFPETIGHRTTPWKIGPRRFNESFVALAASPGYSWQLTELRGICAVVFGIYAVFFPLLSLPCQLLLFGMMAIIDGSLCMIATCAALRRHDHYRVMAVAGLSGWLIGTAALLVPVMDAHMVETLTVVWVSAAGITTAVARAQSGPGLGLINAIAVAAGCLGFCAALWTVAPADTVVAVRWLGCFALALGCMRLWVAALFRAQMLHDMLAYIGITHAE